MSEPESAAPPANAPLTAPVKTVADQAVASGDVAAYREARRAEKSGQPPAVPKAGSRPAEPVEQVASTDALAQDVSETSDTPSPGKSRGNAKTRIAEVDADIVTLRTKLAERDALLAQTRVPVPPSAPATPPAPSTDAALAPEMRTYEAYLEKHPTASLEEYFDARSDARAVLKEQQRETQRRAEALTEAQHKRVTEFSKRINESATADPAFVEKVSPAVIALRPFSSLKPGEKAGPEQVIAEEILSSPVAPQVMVQLSQPEELARLMTMKTPAEIIRAMAQIEARYAPSDEPAPPAHKLTSTPAPVTTLGKRPTDTLAPLEAAIRDGDMTAYKQARTAERAARFTRR